MKRWLVALLVILAVIVFVSPGIVGHLAERNMKQSLRWAQSENQDIEITEEAFARGWFTAEGRHRIELRPGAWRTRVLEFAGRDSSGGVPALIVETRIDHGLVPISSMGRAKGSLVPGLASAVSTLQLDPGDGELMPLPGTLYSRVGLSGESVSRYLVEPGSHRGADTEARWAGADVTLNADPSLRNLDYHGTVEPLSIAAGNQAMRLGQTGFEGDVRYTEYGFTVGSLALRVGGSEADTAGGTLGFARLGFDADSEIEDERLNGNSTMQIEDFMLPGFGELDIAMDVAMNGLDARSLGAIVNRVRVARSSSDPQAALGRLYPEIEADLRTLFSSGAEVRIDRLDFLLPQGQVSTRLALVLPASDRDPDFSWSSLILALTATADIRVPVALMEVLESTSPESQALIGMGLLKKDGDDYIVTAEYRKGLLTVNGAPMPIPLPGQ